MLSVSEPEPELESESEHNTSTRSSIAHEATNVNGDQSTILDESLVASPSTETPPEIRIDEVVNSSNSPESTDSPSAEQNTQLKPDGGSQSSLFRSHSEKLKSRLSEKLHPHHAQRSSWNEPRHDSLFKRVLFDRTLSSAKKEDTVTKPSERRAGDPSIYMSVS